MRVLEVDQLAQQRVVLLVADLRVVQDVVTVVRLVDLRAQVPSAPLLGVQRGIRFFGVAIWMG
jgi:hypothetical protein